MKHIGIHLTLAAALLIAATASLSHARTETKNPDIGKLRHLVLFSLKPEVTEEQKAALEAASAKLQADIPLILSYEWGTEINAGSRAEGITHCLQMTFADEAALNQYLPHPAHEEFKKIFVPMIQKLIVADYIVQP